MKNSYLVSLRQEKNLTKAEMSKQIGVSTSFYDKIESGERQPSYNFIVKLQKAFPGVDANNILNATQSV